MSKGIDNPAASSFTHPRKTGWLYKHGGSGVSSHWRKRWFIADHNYLFYYKSPNDKKPVGILCLPEYSSCHKGDSKEWKKQHTFILDKGNSSQDSESTDGPLKSYVLYSDSDKDMEEWIKVIGEEIKPGVGFKNMANGHPGSKKREDGTSIDQKALDELTKAVSDGPTLSHPTAQRPRVRGRRPPKKYATFHEDDSKEETPPSTPPEQRKEPKSPSPTSSPSTPGKKGHRPTVPMKPKPRTSTTTVALDDQEKKDVDEGKISPGTKQPQKPVPPKKPSKEELHTSALEDSKSPEPTGRPSPTPRPVPPRKPSKEDIGPDMEIMKPAPRKPRPQPPIKPRAATTATATDIPPPSKPETPTIKKPTPMPRPVPRKRSATSENAVDEPKNLLLEPLKETPEKEEEEVFLEPLKEAEEIIPPTPKTEEKPEEEKEVAPIKEEPKIEEIPAAKEPEEDLPKVAPTSTEEKNVSENEEAQKGSNQVREYVNIRIASPVEHEGTTEQVPSESSVNDIMSPGYEHMDPSSTSTVTERSPSPEDYEPMKSGVIVKTFPEVTVSSPEGDQNHEYEEPDEWRPPSTPGETPPLPPPYDEDDYEVPPDLDYDIPPLHGPLNSIYDVPRRVTPAVESHSEDQGKTLQPPSESANSEKSEEESGKQHQTADTRISLDFTDVQEIVIHRAIDSRTPSDSSRSSSRNSNPPTGLTPGKKLTETDSFGYTKVKKKKSELDVEDKRISQLSFESEVDEKSDWVMVGKNTEESSLDTVPATLKQAREVLRLAKVVRAEAEQTKREAYRELDLARRERQDAETLKRNAAEILRMAKERLHVASSKH